MDYNIILEQTINKIKKGELTLEDVKGWKDYEYIAEQING